MILPPNIMDTDPPYLSKEKFLAIMNLQGYNLDAITYAIDLAEKVHDHDYGHYAYNDLFYLKKYGIREDDTGKFFDKESEKWIGSTYLNGHLLPVAFSFLDHALKNRYAPTLDDMLTLILHDAREDIREDSPYCTSLGLSLEEGKRNLDTMIITNFGDRTFQMINLLTKKPDQQFTNYQRLEFLSESEFLHLVPMEYCDRNMGMAARLHFNTYRRVQEDRAKGFILFAQDHRELVWNSLTDEMLDILTR